MSSSSSTSRSSSHEMSPRPFDLPDDRGSPMDEFILPRPDGSGGLSTAEYPVPPPPPRKPRIRTSTSSHTDASDNENNLAKRTLFIDATATGPFVLPRSNSPALPSISNSVPTSPQQRSSSSRKAKSVPLSKTGGVKKSPSKSPQKSPGNKRPKTK